MAENKARRKRRSDKAANGIRTTLAGHRHVLIAGSGLPASASPSPSPAPVRSTERSRSATPPPPGAGHARCTPPTTNAPMPSPQRAGACFEALGIWGQIAGEAQAMRDIGDHRQSSRRPVRPAFLNFDGEIAPRRGVCTYGARTRPSGSPAAGLPRGGGRSAPCRRAPLHSRYGGWRGHAPDGERLPVNLCVAADGAKSRLREAAGIGWVGWSYPQVWASSRRSAMSAITAGVPSSISCHPGPSRCCP